VSGYRAEDPELEESTNRVMVAGACILIAMALVFPLYRWYEPGSRESAHAEQRESLAQAGGQLWSLNCSSCHGLNGEGGIGPALNSQQFLSSATDAQIELLVSVGVPGTQMSAYSQDFAGPLTSEQIKALAVYLRSWEPDAPDRPDWRSVEPAG
jgi:mono/diheme cytochrome c family protein